MTEDGRNECGTRRWTESLITKVKSVKASDKESGWNEEIQEDLLSALELLCEKGLSPSFDAKALDGVSEQIAESIDASLSHWQQQLTQEFGRSITKELDKQLKHVLQLEKDLEEEREALEERCQELSERTALLNQREAKTARQRKAIAKELRAKKLSFQLELERSRKEIRDELRSESAQECDDLIKGLEDQVASGQEELTTMREKLASKRDEIDSLKEQLEAKDDELESVQEHTSQKSDVEDKLRSELEEAIERLEEANDKLEKAEVAQAESAERATESENEQIAGLEHELLEVSREKSELQEETAELKDQLVAEQQKLDSLQSQLEEAEIKAEQAEEKAAEQATSMSTDDSAGRIIELETEIAKLNDELELAKEAIGDNESFLKDKGAEEELDRFRQQIADLEGQNADLAAQLAKTQVAQSASQPHVQFDQESLSWEERKALILEQLESETDGGGAESADGSAGGAARRVEIDDILSSTQKEIEKRDAEIAELQDIIEQQSDTKQGVAIGAAAIAQMLDSDDLVVQERQKLKEIQAQWEEKLRQAEIDVSLERARLARERQQLEAELEEAKRALPPKENPKEGRTRKWLDHLGLREEKGNQ